MPTVRTSSAAQPESSTAWSAPARRDNASFCCSNQTKLRAQRAINSAAVTNALPHKSKYLTLPNPLHNKAAMAASAQVFAPSDFAYDADARTCVCPAGKSLYRKGRANRTKDYIGERFRGAKRDCGPCTLRTHCLRTPETTPVRNVAFFRDRVRIDAINHTAVMKARIDSPQGRAQYGQRFGTVEPVFANLRYDKRHDRFTLRIR